MHNNIIIITMTYFFYQGRSQYLLCNVGIEWCMPLVHPDNVGSKLSHNILIVEDFWQPLDRSDIGVHQGAGPQTCNHSPFDLEPIGKELLAI